MAQAGAKSLAAKTLIAFAVTSSTFALLVLVVPIVAPKSALARYLSSIISALYTLIAQPAPVLKYVEPIPAAIVESAPIAAPIVAARSPVVAVAAEAPVFESAEVPVESEQQIEIEIARVGKAAPVFTADAVIGESIEKISLESYRGKYLVVFFYPLDFTFVCPTEIIEFSDKIDQFNAINCSVVGISVDSAFTHLAWTKTARREGGIGTINYPLVSDLTHSISKEYGVYMDDAGHSLRGTFIINEKGIVRHLSMNDPPVGRNVDEILRLVKAYQFVDVNGEVCPASWTAGEKTIKPNPVDKLEYFQQVNE